jgi:VWFA-related protein
MRAATLVIAFVLAVGATNAQQPAQPPILKTTTAGVLIDVTVVDRKGQVVLDLRPEDFQLSEDGARQQILSMTLVQGGVVRAAARADPGQRPADQPSGPPSPPDAVLALDDTPSVTAILFDRLSPEMRPLARQAALAYLSTLTSGRDYAGVFLSDLAFRIVQPFTDQPDRLLQAIDRIASTAPSSLTADAERARNTRIQVFDPNQPVTAGAESGEGFVTVAERERRIKLEGKQGKLVEMEIRMEEGYQRFVAELGGQASLAGLNAVVSALGVLPGRKSVLYFTESLAVTTSLKAKFDALIGEANRNNVTFYPVDAAGLRVHSKEAELGRNVNLGGAQGTGDAKRPDGAWTKELERQDEMLSSGPTAALGRLAKETGGFVVDNTNDLGKGVARMQQERTTYYLLAYQSNKPALDGTFRRVEVKVKRSNVTVKGRSGYKASFAPQK